MNKNRPKVIISVLNWNAAALTQDCLEALRIAIKQADALATFRLVIVDNDSFDDSVQCLNAWRKKHNNFDCLLIENDHNAGFAGGHKLAYQKALEWQADAICLVNNDAIIQAEALCALLDAWADTGEAIFGGLPLREDSENGFKKVSVNFPSKYLSQNRTQAIFQRDQSIVFDLTWQQRAPFKVNAVVGSLLFLPMKLIEQNTWLDLAWFMYCEEIDYCWRLRARGVPSILVPQAQIKHAGGGSSENNARVGDVMFYYRTRNELGLCFRYQGFAYSFVMIGKKIMRAGWTCCYRPQRAWLIFRGVLDAVTGKFGKVIAPEEYWNAQ